MAAFQTGVSQPSKGQNTNSTTLDTSARRPKAAQVITSRIWIIQRKLLE